MIVTSATPAILFSDKLMTITNLTALVPIKLDIDEMNYSSLVDFFKNHCKGFELLEHILGTPTDVATSNDPVPPTSEWLKIDSIVLSWIFTMMSKTLQQMLVIENPQTAKEAWDIFAEIFNDNKSSRSIALKAELRSLGLGDLSIDAYFRKIESIATILSSLGSPIGNDDIVNIALEGLLNKYENASSIIIHREPFPDLKMVRLMLTTEEMRLKSRAQTTSIDSSSSSPMVLLANSGNTNTRRPVGASGKISKLCFNFARGFCHFGDNCRYIHGGTNIGVTNNTSLWSTSTTRPNSSSASPNMTPEKMMSLIQTQQAFVESVWPLVRLTSPPGFSQPMFGHASLGNQSSSDGSWSANMPSSVAWSAGLVEFDAFGFLVKDHMTRRVLLRCNSTGDLYPVMKPSPIPHAFLVIQYMWHQRLGHPGSEVLHRVLFSNSISCNKEKPPHALSCLSAWQTREASICPSSPLLAQHETQPTPVVQPIPAQYTSPPPTSPTIVTPNPNPNPVSVHPMVIRFHVGTNHPTLTTLSRYKTRLVANGSMQLSGVDVDVTFSLVVKPCTILIVFSLVISRHWPVHQLDIKNAFLHGNLSKTVYMHQPPGFWDSANPDYVCLLQRSLYGLK
ncbi:ribonuclease H-like domain-containing protein [Tanacetum coccineum]|uniref:Ribonuclease H-like domain-containing protein n=1 Tax=Tanacetum coccineum TaxID=301880 RepID=A0ABQ5BF70_9ASTR